MNGIQAHVSADINNDGGKTFLTTQNDWETSAGEFTRIHLAFQCTAGYGGGLRPPGRTKNPPSTPQAGIPGSTTPGQGIEAKAGALIRRRTRSKPHAAELGVFPDALLGVSEPVTA
jgi:hypothetical protein